MVGEVEGVDERALVEGDLWDPPEGGGEDGGGRDEGGDFRPMVEGFKYAV